MHVERIQAQSPLHWLFNQKLCHRWSVAVSWRFCVVVTGVGVFEFEGTTLYSCERCGKCYKYRSGLYKHTRYECGMDGQFQCPHCPYKAKQKSNLKIHVFAKHKPSKWQHSSTCYFPIKIFLLLLLACYSLFVFKINFMTKTV